MVQKRKAPSQQGAARLLAYTGEQTNGSLAANAVSFLSVSQDGLKPVVAIGTAVVQSVAGFAAFTCHCGCGAISPKAETTPVPLLPCEEQHEPQQEVARPLAQHDRE